MRGESVLGSIERKCGTFDRVNGVDKEKKCVIESVEEKEEE